MPAVLFGGTWTQLEDTFLYAQGSKTAGETGGEETHTLTESELPMVEGWFQIHGQENGTIFYNLMGNAIGARISNAYTTNTKPLSGAHSYQNIGLSFGGGYKHNNMPPYLVVYIWKRTN